MVQLTILVMIKLMFCDERKSMEMHYISHADNAIR